MANVVLNFWTHAYGSITNRIKATIFTQVDPNAEVDSIIDTVSGHPARAWTFAGLPRANYGMSLDEIDGSGNPINNLSLWAVVPGVVDGTLARANEQVQVGVTAGWVVGTNTATLDGSTGKADWRGWEIIVNRTGGTAGDVMVKGLDYSWDIVNAVFTLLISGDVLAAEWLNVMFDAQDDPQPDSVSTVNDLQNIYKTADYTLVAADFGKRLIVDPAGTYATITLPDLATLVDGRPLKVLIGSVGIKCVNFVTTLGQTIAFLLGSRTNLIACPSESFTICKRLISTGVYEFRIYDAVGNFISVGTQVSNDTSSMINAAIMQGQDGDVFAMARLYNEWVLNLPGAQVVNYDDWGVLSGTNLFFSLANSSNPAHVNKFKIADRRGIMEMNSDSSNIPGAFNPSQVGDHSHPMHGGGKIPGLGSGSYIGRSGGASSKRYSAGGGTDLLGATADGNPDLTMTTGNNNLITKKNSVETYSNNKFILL